MSTTWITCDIDAKEQDQYTTTYSLTDGSARATLIQTWIVVCESTTPGTVQSNPVEASVASVVGGNSIPQAGSMISMSGFTGTVTRLMPKRIGPTSFHVQVQAEWVYQPVKSSSKFNVTITVDGQTSTQDAYYDENNKPIVNSAKCSYDTTIKEEIYDEVFDITYSTTSDQSAAFAAVRGQVNNAAISFAIQGVSRSFAERGLKCIGAKQTADIPLGSGTPAFKCNLRFGARTDGWQVKVLDQGFYTLDPITNQLNDVLDQWGNNLNAVALLDGAGNQLVPGAPPVYNTFKLETEADFTAVFSGLA